MESTEETAENLIYSSIQKSKTSDSIKEHIYENEKWEESKFHTGMKILTVLKDASIRFKCKIKQLIGFIWNIYRISHSM